MGLEDVSVTKPGFGDLIPAVGMTADERLELEENGWRLTDSQCLLQILGCIATTFALRAANLPSRRIRTYASGVAGLVNAAPAT